MKLAKKTIKGITLGLRLPGVCLISFCGFFIPLFSDCLSGMPALGPSSLADLGLLDNEISFE